MSEKHKKVCIALTYFEHFLVYVSTVSRSVSISAFASSNIDFCHLQDIRPLIAGKLLDIFTKAGLDVSKATSKNVVHKRA